MDYDKDRAALKQYEKHVHACQTLPFLSKERRAALKDLNPQKTNINRILADLLPDHGLISGTSLGSHQAALNHVGRAQTLMGGDGIVEDDNGESYLRFQTLHDLVWVPANDHWDAGRYRSAVADAATNVSQFTQRRIGRYDISEKDLMCQAFTPKPPEQGSRASGAPESRRSDSPVPAGGGHALRDGVLRGLPQPGEPPDR